MDLLLFDDDLLDVEDHAGEFDEMEEEEEDEEGGVDVVIKQKKKRARPNRASKEDTQVARVKHRAYLVGCATHAVWIERKSRELSLQEMQPLGNVDELSDEQVNALLLEQWDLMDATCDTLGELAARVASWARRVFELPCRIVFSAPFMTWKPNGKPKKKKKGQKRRRKPRKQIKRRKVVKKKQKTKPAKKQKKEDADEKGKEEDEGFVLSSSSEIDEEEFEESDSDEMDDDEIDYDEDDDDDLGRSEYWIELWRADEGWVPMRLRSGKEPVAYVLTAVEGSRVRDVTSHYSNDWHHTVRNMRFDEVFLQETLEALERSQGPVGGWVQQSDSWDRSHHETITEEQAFPTSRAAFKMHPTFVLEDQLLIYAALYPDAKPVGTFLGVNIFLRRHVSDLHTADKWLDHARTVIKDSEPAKKVKSKQKKDKDAVLYGRWQTEPYDPGDVVDGKIPKNPHGNVWLYKPEMMPRGAEHVPGVSISTARLLGVDAAQAVVGWTFKRGASYPNLAPGIVVASEFVEALVMAEEEARQVERQKHLRRERGKAIKNWKRLLRRGLIFRRLGRDVFNNNAK